MLSMFSIEVFYYNSIILKDMNAFRTLINLFKDVFYIMINLILFILALGLLFFNPMDLIHFDHDA